MMNIFYKTIGCCVLAYGLCACAQDRNELVFKGISSENTAGLYNPGRGFRLETAVDVVEDQLHPERQLDELSRKYASDSVSLVQCYFYLTELTGGKKLQEEHFQAMQRYFDEVRKLGKKVVLRFAYEKDFIRRKPVGPTLDDILIHVQQLKPFLEKNKDLILVVQAGLIGAWGEWHSSVHGLENSKEAQIAVLEKLLSVVPEELNVQVRVPEYKNLLQDHPALYRRLSFHDDFIVIKPDRWDGDMHEGTANFDQIVRESPYLVVDGELPWGFWSVGCDPDSPSAGWIIEGLPAARRLFLQHYTSLSVIHNYKEQHPNNRFDENNPPQYSMVVWKNTWVPEDSIRKYKMPVSDSYFRDETGKPVMRSMFDYIRDHLGYRLELQKLTYPKVWHRGMDEQLSLSLINRGFATVAGTHRVYWALIDEAGKVTAFPVQADPRTWQPHHPGDSTYTPLLHQIDATVRVPESLPAGTYKLGFWIADASEELKQNARYAIRCANANINWYTGGNNTYGINVLTEVQVK